MVVWPLDCHEAALTIAYAKLKCEELYGQQCWLGSVLSLGQIAADAKYPTVDFQAWARYGSWSHCSFCGSLSFNDQYFRDHVYQQQATSEKAGMASVHRMAIPSDPVVHSHGDWHQFQVVVSGCDVQAVFHLRTLYTTRR